jgi:hypothetical protein
LELWQRRTFGARTLKFLDSYSPKYKLQEYI